jgi:hypothetical protein
LIEKSCTGERAYRSPRQVCDRKRPFNSQISLKFWSQLKIAIADVPWVHGFAMIPDAIASLGSKL